MIEHYNEKVFSIWKYNTETVIHRLLLIVFYLPRMDCVIYQSLLCVFLVALK